MNKLSKGRLVMEAMEQMMEDIVDTALKFIPLENKTEFILNCSLIVRLHRINVETIIKNDS